ncbi:hypothetical protein HKD37_05G013250 [Glycine soja]
MDINPLRMVLLLSYEKVKNKNNNLDKSKVEIKSTQRKSKECREEESKRKIYTGSATTRAYVQSPSNHRITTQVDVRSTSTTKDVRSNVLIQRIFRRGKRKNQKNSQAVSPLNLLARGRRKNQKNSQAVSPLNILARGRRKKR